MRDLACGVRFTTPDPACGHHGCWDGWAEPLRTWPNLVTAVRAVGTAVLSAAALATGRPDLLLAGLVVYLVLDVVDGWVARWLRQETRAGALFDVLADRASSVAFWLPWAVWHPEVALPVSVYVLEFVLVDGLLSTLWLAWPLLSCNHTARVDPWVHRLNWSPPAKALNTGVLVVLVLLWPQPLLATVAVTAVLVLKVVSLVRLHGLLPAPGPGCATRPLRPPVRTTSPTP